MQRLTNEHWPSPEPNLTVNINGELIEFDLNELIVQKKSIIDRQGRKYTIELEDRVVNIIAGPGGPACSRCAGSGREPDS